MNEGRLTVVGIGIQLGQTTMEAIGHIESADLVLYLSTDPVTAEWIHNLNPNARSMLDFYSPERNRLVTYEAMVEHALGYVRQGQRVCMALYGHPGVFVHPSHKAVARARAEGYAAHMLPGVSAEDCLFADLGVDPAAKGCHSFEATDFLVHERVWDPRSYMILWQIGVIGDIGYKEEYSLENLHVLLEQLIPVYGVDHLVAVYEASRYVVLEPRIDWMKLQDLPFAQVKPISTLCVPPKSEAIPNLEMVDRLGIPRSYLLERRNLEESEGQTPPPEAAISARA